jgi:hypothetical protein
MEQIEIYFHLASQDNFEDYYSFKKIICQNLFCSKEYTLSNVKPGMTKNYCSFECLAEYNSTNCDLFFEN